VVKPTSKVRDTARQLEDTAIETRRNTRQTTRNVPAEEQIDRPTETRKSSGSGSGSSYGRVSQAGHGLNDPQEQQPLVIKLGDLK
jgi:hypothetical protein